MSRYSVQTNINVKMLSLLVQKEMQTKITPRYSFSPFRLAKNRSLATHCICENVGNSPINCQEEYKVVQTLWRVC